MIKTKAVRLYGKNDLRLEEFELPSVKNDEILAHIISDSLCMSSYKAAVQGANHKIVSNIKDVDIIILYVVGYCDEVLPPVIAKELSDYPIILWSTHDQTF